MQEKNLSWLLGSDKKICPLRSLFSITRQKPRDAKQRPSDGLFYSHLTLTKDSYILFPGSLIMHFYMSALPTLCAIYMSHVTRKPVFGVSDQVRLKPVSSATETSYSLEILDLVSIRIIPSRQ